MKNSLAWSVYKHIVNERNDSVSLVTHMATDGCCGCLCEDYLHSRINYNDGCGDDDGDDDG
jgi:hypothetical protein